MVGELAVDARKVALSSREQRLFVLKRSGELIGVASQVGFFAGEAILRRLELGIECVKEVIEPLEEPDAVSRHLGRIECAGSCVLQGIAPRRRITNPTSGFFRPNGILRLEIEETRRTVLPRVIS